MFNKIIKSTLLIILFFFPKISTADIDIILTVDDNIITNYDIEKEGNYLKILNPNLAQLDNDRLLRLSKNSLINETIKKKELIKYLDLNTETLKVDQFLNDLYKKLDIENEDDFKIFLKENNSFSIDEVKEKIKLETFWNELIYTRHRNKLKIDKDAIIKKVDSLDGDEIKEYLLSEIVFDIKKDFSTAEMVDLVKLSIKEIGFNNTANVYSVSTSSKLGGKLGWVNESNLSKQVVKQMKLIDEGKYTDIIKIGNSYLILKIEKIRITKTKIDKNKEIKKLIQIETNKQLNKFSNIDFKKAKMNYSINEK